MCGGRGGNGETRALGLSPYTPSMLKSGPRCVWLDPGTCLFLGKQCLVAKGLFVQRRDRGKKGGFGMFPERATPAEGRGGRSRAEAHPVFSGAVGLRVAAAGQGEG